MTTAPTANGTSTTLPLPTSLLTSTPLSLLQADITSALLSAGSIPRIQAALTHELQASGWTQRLRTRIVEMIRSGEAATYGEIMRAVEGEIAGKHRPNSQKQNGVVDGEKDGEGKEGIEVPKAAVEEGIRAVRRELEAVCEIVVDDE